MPKKLAIEIGDTFNRLTVLEEIKPPNVRQCRGHRYFKCQCSCAEKTIKDVRLDHLVHSRVQSCGCLKKEYQQPVLEDSHNWRGGKHKDSGGYCLVYFPDHPNSKNNGYVREHTLVMSKLLGRALKQGENVHHKNGIRDDNRPENLELWTTSQPSGQRVEDKIAWCLEYLNQYKEFLTDDQRKEIDGLHRN